MKIDKFFKGNRLDLKFGKSLAALNHKIAPELVQMDKEMNELTKKYARTELKQSQQVLSG